MNIKGDNSPIILIGNKCDLKEEEKVITKEEREKLANNNGFAFFETSEESVQFLVSKIIDRMQREKNSLNIDWINKLLILWIVKYQI